MIYENYTLDQEFESRGIKKIGWIYFIILKMHVWE